MFGFVAAFVYLVTDGPKQTAATRFCPGCGAHAESDHCPGCGGETAEREGVADASVPNNAGEKFCFTLLHQRYHLFYHPGILSRMVESTFGGYGTRLIGEQRHPPADDGWGGYERQAFEGETEEAVWTS